VEHKNGGKKDGRMDKMLCGRARSGPMHAETDFWIFERIIKCLTG
jgi:hypothetical protein